MPGITATVAASRTAASSPTSPLHFAANWVSRSRPSWPRLSINETLASLWWRRAEQRREQSSTDGPLRAERGPPRGARSDWSLRILLVSRPSVLAALIIRGAVTSASCYCCAGAAALCATLRTNREALEGLFHLVEVPSRIGHRQTACNQRIAIGPAPAGLGASDAASASPAATAGEPITASETRERFQGNRDRRCDWAKLEEHVLFRGFSRWHG